MQLMYIMNLFWRNKLINNNNNNNNNNYNNNTYMAGIC